MFWYKIKNWYISRDQRHSKKWENRNIHFKNVFFLCYNEHYVMAWQGNAYKTRIAFEAEKSNRVGCEDVNWRKLLSIFKEACHGYYKFPNMITSDYKVDLETTHLLILIGVHWPLSSYSDHSTLLHNLTAIHSMTFMHSRIQ